MAHLLGIGQCVIRGCTSQKARFTLSSAGLAVCTDKVKGGCQSQAFARDEEGDEFFRACITPAGAPAAPPPVAETVIEEPGQPGHELEEVQQAAPPAEPAPAKPKIQWGIFAGRDA